MLKSIIYHPILLSIFPTLLVYSQNIHLVVLEGLLLPFVVIIAVASVMWIILYILLKNTTKSALLTSVYTVLFFTFGHLSSIFSDNLPQIPIFHLNIILGLFYGIIAVIFSVFIFKTNRLLNNASSIGNVMSLVLVLFLLINIGMFTFQNQSVLDENNSVPLSLSNIPENVPDVYYIIMDEYAPSKTLENVYDYDNSNFEKFLIQKGFFVAKNSHSNYAETFLALASTLNMKYANNLTEIVGSDSIDQSIPYSMINNNIVMKNFKNLGYEIYNFDSGWWGTRQLSIADENICGKNQNLDFHILYKLKQTSILSLVDSSIKSPTMEFFHNEQRDRINCQFEKISKIKELGDKPIFVLMHVMAPHDPYVFGPNGESVDYEYTFGANALGDVQVLFDAKQAYLDQLSYISKLLQKSVNEILSNNPNSVIIIQSDTGPFMPDDSTLTDEQKEIGRMAIFNAYHFPENTYHKIYDNITPVNTFRIIFNEFFESDLKILDDQVFYSTYDEPYLFREIIDTSLYP
tara:strand:+ start:145 stop:1698 length:1554 start_codon:yes stop_codon:yes gene_type:complete